MAASIDDPAEGFRSTYSWRFWFLSNVRFDSSTIWIINLFSTIEDLRLLWLLDGLFISWSLLGAHFRSGEKVNFASLSMWNSFQFILRVWWLSTVDGSAHGLIYFLIVFLFFSLRWWAASRSHINEDGFLMRNSLTWCRTFFPVSP